MRRAAIVLTLGSSLAFGCHNDAEKHGHAHDDKSKAHAHAHKKPTEAAHGPHLKLNDGKKWQTDAHTRVVMQEIGASLKSAAPTSVAEYKALGATLKKQVQKLVKGCTMKGPAHDELHVFLTSFMPAAAALAQASDTARAKQTLEELRHLILAFNKHFA